MVKQPTSEQSEFTMSSEDFPALPGTSNTGSAPPPPATAASSGHGPDYHSAEKPRKGIQTSPDGKASLVFAIYWANDVWRSNVCVSIPTYF